MSVNRLLLIPFIIELIVDYSDGTFFLFKVQRQKLCVTLLKAWTLYKEQSKRKPTKSYHKFQLVLRREK